MASTLQQGIDAAKAGRMQEALDYLKDAIIEEPQNAEVWVWIAAIIEDIDKQEIFLERALEIDPNNIPAQRGLAYLHKQKQAEPGMKPDHLSDHTQPISPFPNASQPKQFAKNAGWSKLILNDLDQIAQSRTKKASQVKNTRMNKKIPDLSLLEISLLGVVVIVFCFIGILASSAIFDFELPLGAYLRSRPSLAAEPPYPGTFLYENGVFLNLQQHEGLPTDETGIPSTLERDPLLVFFETATPADQLDLIYETGEFIPFRAYAGRGNTSLIQPVNTLNPGLYCFQYTKVTEPTTEIPFYWCFIVKNLAPEG